jgi:hypothetical protein
MSGESSTEKHTTTTYISSDSCVKFGESLLDYICPVSPLQKYIPLVLRTFPVTPPSLDFGESSLDYICPVSPLQKYILPLRTFPVTPPSLDFGESSTEIHTASTYISSDSSVT